MARSNLAKKTWKYTDEFKAKAVQLSLLEGVKVQEVAQTLDIHPFMLSRWRKEFREGKIMPNKCKKVISLCSEESDINKIKKLKNEVKRLKQENTLLKKWQRFLGATHRIGIDSSRETGSLV